MINLPKIEFHILQSFPSTCLNRDDLGSPKTATIGGSLRGRISSQCFKRAVRLKLKEQGKTLAHRTTHLADLLYRNSSKKDDAECKEVCSYVATALTKDNTMIFISLVEQEAILKFIETNYDDLKKEVLKSKKKGKSKKDETNEEVNDKDEKKAAFKKLLNNLLIEQKDISLIPYDLALFGRMIASAPALKIEGASYFSHAITTHKIQNNLDFFTAVSDDEQEGSGFLSVSEFNSGTYYRYICLDLNILAKNFNLQINNQNDLQKCKTSLKDVVSNFIIALFEAVPSGRQHSFAGFSAWDFARVYVRKGQPLQAHFDKAVQLYNEETKTYNSGYLEVSKNNLVEFLDMKEKIYGSIFGLVEKDGKKGKFDFGCEESYSIDKLIDDIVEVI